MPQWADDAEERASDGQVSRASSDLELTDDGGWDGRQTVGLRFPAVAVPPDATITRAYIEFETDETDSLATSLSLHGEANDHAPGFQATALNISGRARTSASVPWTDLPAWTVVDQKQRTPDLAPIVQEIVNRPGWVGGNAMVFIVSGSGERTAEAYDGEPGAAPLLHVEYTGGRADALQIRPPETPPLPLPHERDEESLWLPLVLR